MVFKTKTMTKAYISFPVTVLLLNGIGDFFRDYCLINQNLC